MKLDLITNKADKFKNGINLNDEFYTPPYAIYPIIKYLKPKSTVWCPFDTEISFFVKILKQEGFTVISSHISNNQSFFDMEIPKNVDYIISNPPYSLKYEVFLKLFDLKIPFAMLVGVVGLFESKNRFSMFSENQFEIMYFDKRISYFKDYNDIKPSLNPPFSSVYLCSGVLSDKIIFKKIEKQK